MQTNPTIAAAVAPPRAAPTKCPACGAAVDHQHEVGRAARRKSYCDATCRRRHQRARDFAKHHGDDTFSRSPTRDTAGGEKAPRKPLKSHLEKERDCRSSLCSSAPLNLLGGGYRWPASPHLDRELRRKILRAEVGDVMTAGAVA